MKYLLLCIALCLFFQGCQTGKKDEKPNIIFLLTDDQRDNTFGAMGHPVIQSPNIDLLLKESVRFSNTYIAAPVCSPSRVSLFTGMPNRVHGVGFASSYQLSEEQWSKTYPALLRENGYHTGFIGKIGIEFYSFRGEAPEKFDFWRGHDGWAKFFPKTQKNCIEYVDYNNEIITPIMGECMEDFLQTRPDDKPFCLSVSFSVPHGSQIRSMYPEKEEAIWCGSPANENPKLAGNPFYDTLFRNNPIRIPEETATNPYVHIPKSILDKDKGRTATYRYDYDTLRSKEHHIRYFQQITALDKIIGDLLKSLEDKGLSDNTVIIFASDHGLLMGEYGMGGKALLYDLTSKIPCFIFDPHLPDEKRGRNSTELVSSLDISTTILDYAGLAAPERMSGKSLLPLVYDEADDWRGELFLESLFTLRDNPVCEGIRYGDWKYIRMYKMEDRNYEDEDLLFGDLSPGFEQLFNLKADPEEMINLIADYEGSELLEDLRNRVARYSEEMNERRVEFKLIHEEEILRKE